MLTLCVWQGLQHEAPEVNSINGFVEHFNCIWMSGQCTLLNRIQRYKDKYAHFQQFQTAWRVQSS